ncbi:type VI secretion system baseplate subunit TssG [Gangjinia marincola]|uniref:Type VI secretion system baseplate subunit TssG n=1 Tax=Gangjinia marincola TaxID=578463 RepID=A0ABN1MJQ6_9FLAO
MSEEKIEQILNELRTSYQNYKAEVYALEVLQNSDLSLSQLDIYFKSIFSRSYRRDVIDFSLDRSLKTTSRIQINVARNGLYDTLPEGLFHRPIDYKNNIPYNKARQEQKRKEEEARTFFSPLDNEFFIQSLTIEKNERELIDRFTNLKNEFLNRFWNIGDEIPDQYKSTFLRLLPYAHQIAGNLTLTKLALENILHEEVIIKKSYQNKGDNAIDQKTDQALGIDFTLHVEEPQVHYPSLEITVNQISKNDVRDYVSKGKTEQFISIFCDYFIPLEYDVTVNVTVRHEAQGLTLDPKNAPRIGFTTTL